MEKTYGISVRSVLDMEVLKGAKLFAGRGGLDRIVTSMNVMVETPDIVKWVSPGDLLVTTAYSIRDDVKRLASLVPVLNAHGVVGLGIKPKEFIPEMPREVIEAANALSFPIFEIPAELSFSKIITPVLTTILNNQAQVLMDIYDLQKSLTATMLSGGNLQAITQTLHNRYGNSVAIYNEFFSSYVISAAFSRRDVIYRQMENCVRGSGMNDLAADFSNTLSRRERCMVDGKECTKITVPIYSDKKLYGYIFMWEDNREITSVDLAVIEASTSLIALDMIKKISIFEMENNHKVSFLDDLLVNDDLSQRRALANAEYFDFDIEAVHQVAVVQVCNTNNSLSLSNGALYKMNNSIVRVLRRLSRNAACKLLFVNKCDNIVLVFENKLRSTDLCKQEVTQFMETLCGALRGDSLLEFICIGVGRAYREAADLWKSLAEAKRAASCGPIDREHALCYEDLGVYRFLSYENLQPELLSFYTETLKVLVDYDREHDSELVHTLSLYFKCNGNLKRLAEELGVHYNTVAYRIQRIKELAGVSFDNSDQLLNLQIALKIHEIHKTR